MSKGRTERRKAAKASKQALRANVNLQKIKLVARATKHARNVGWEGMLKRQGKHFADYASAKVMHSQREPHRIKGAQLKKDVANVQRSIDNDLRPTKMYVPDPPPRTVDPHNGLVNDHRYTTSHTLHTNQRKSVVSTAKRHRAWVREHAKAERISNERTTHSVMHLLEIAGMLHLQ